MPVVTVNVAGLKPCASVVPLVVRITVHRPVSGLPDRSTAFTLIDCGTVVLVAEDVVDGELVPITLIADTR